MGAPDLPMFLRCATRLFGKNGRKFFDDFKKIAKNFGKTTPTSSATGSRNIKKLALFLNNADNAKDLKGLLSKAGKLGAGALIPAFFAYLHAAAASESWGPGMNSGNTYYAMITGMLTGGQLASTGKSLYQKRRANKMAKLNKEAAKEATHILKRLEIEQEVSNIEARLGGAKRGV
jgi:hypothetical protein